MSSGAKTLIVLAIIVSFIFGCGGSGGTAEECNNSVACIGPDPEFTVDSSALLGLYSTSITLRTNSCEGASPLAQLSESYLVTSGLGYHAIPTIDVSSSTGAQFQNFSSVGNTDGVSYFKVFQVGSQELLDFVPNMVCSESISLNFSNVNQGKALVERVSEIDCANPGETIVQGISAHCQVVYQGEASFAAQ